jgi:hypothetical protein
MALVALAVVPVMAQVPVFSPFNGDVEIDDADAPVGSQLRAYVNGAAATLLEPAVGNVFTLTTAGEYEVVIQTTATGQAVTFEVMKAGTTTWLPATSDPAAPVTSYQPQGVDLSAYSGALEAPTVVTVAATNVAMTTATLNGNLTDMGTATSVTVYFDYGATTAYGSVMCQTVRTSTGTFTCNVTGIPAGATRHFRAVAVGHGTDLGDDMMFTTSAEPTPPGEYVTFADWLYEEFVS